MRNGLIRSGPRVAFTATSPQDDPGPLGELALEARRQTGLVERFARGDETELDVAVHPAQFLAIEDAAGIEVADLRTHPRAHS